VNLFTSHVLDLVAHTSLILSVVSCFGTLGKDLVMRFYGGCNWWQLQNPKS